MTHPLGSADISSFYQNSTTFVLVKNTDKNCILMLKFYFFNIFFESLKVVLITMLAILMMSAKLATLGLIKIKVT